MRIMNQRAFRLCGSSRNTDVPLEGALGDFLLLKDFRAEIAHQPLGVKNIHSIIGASVNLVIVEFFEGLLCLPTLPNFACWRRPPAIPIPRECLCREDALLHSQRKYRTKPPKPRDYFNTVSLI